MTHQPIHGMQRAHQLLEGTETAGQVVVHRTSAAGDVHFLRFLPANIEAETVPPERFGSREQLEVYLLKMTYPSTAAALRETARDFTLVAADMIRVAAQLDTEADDG